MNQFSVWTFKKLGINLVLSQHEWTFACVTSIMYCITESKRIFKMLLIAGIYIYGEREREREIILSQMWMHYFLNLSLFAIIFIQLQLVIVTQNLNSVLILKIIYLP